MGAQQVEQKVRTIIAEQLGISEDEVQRESTFIEDLGADSLDIVELLMALEEELNMDIPDEDAESMRNVGDLIDYLVSKSTG